MLLDEEKMPAGTPGLQLVAPVGQYADRVAAWTMAATSIPWRSHQTVARSSWRQARNATHRITAAARQDFQSRFEPMTSDHEDHTFHRAALKCATGQRRRTVKLWETLKIRQPAEDSRPRQGRVNSVDMRTESTSRTAHSDATSVCGCCRI